MLTQLVPGCSYVMFRRDRADDAMLQACSLPLHLTGSPLIADCRRCHVAGDGRCSVSHADSFCGSQACTLAALKLMQGARRAVGGRPFWRCTCWL